jgi:hypothetical protein
LSILFSCATGCETKGGAQLRAQQAFVAGQEQALAHSGPQAPMVTVNGPVRNSMIPWTEDLTLATAILAADYTAFSQPRFIRVTRGGQTINVRPTDLLHGQDMPLEAGDIVELAP